MTTLFHVIYALTFISGPEVLFTQAIRCSLASPELVFLMRHLFRCTKKYDSYQEISRLIYIKQWLMPLGVKRRYMPFFYDGSKNPQALAEDIFELGCMYRTCQKRDSVAALACCQSVSNDDLKKIFQWMTDLKLCRR
jgi:hypothetical protein